MILNRLSISLQTYGIHDGKYVGTAHFQNEHGAVELVLDPTVAQRALEMCADALVLQATKTANLLVSAVIQQAPVLSAPVVVAADEDEIPF